VIGVDCKAVVDTGMALVEFGRVDFNLDHRRVAAEFAPVETGLLEAQTRA
jgi:hypothetical protein